VGRGGILSQNNEKENKESHKNKRSNEEVMRYINVLLSQDKK